MKKYKRNFRRMKNKKILNQDGEKKLIYLIIGLLSILFIILILSGGQGIWGLSVILARIIGFVIIIILGYLMVNWSSSITEETEVLKEKKKFETDKNLQIEEITTLLDRASDGKTKSQEMLHDKIKDIFFIKLKETRDLSMSELRDLMKKPEKFRDIVQDDMISDFILSLEKENKTDFDPEKMNEEQYKDMIREIIQEISEWD